jgi:RHS repeat-associated protein
MRIRLQRHGGEQRGCRMASQAGHFTPTTPLRCHLRRRSDCRLVGVWPNRDPIGERGGLNLYGFVRNNPISRIDHHGLSDENSPSGKLCTRVQGTPEGFTDMVEGKPEVAHTYKGEYKIAGPTGNGEGDDADIQIPYMGEGYEPLKGDEPFGKRCKVKYSCKQKCKSCLGRFQVTWDGAWGMSGQTAPDLRTGRTICGVPDSEKIRAMNDCATSASGRCNVECTLTSH